MAKTSCTCEKCRNACKKNPGWFAPEEAAMAIQRGYAGRMMRDWLEPCKEVRNKNRIYVLAAASNECEGTDAPQLNFMDMFSDQSKGRCTFLNEYERCEIHRSGFKPMQCRTTFVCREKGADNYDMARMWKTKRGREVVRMWQRAVKR